jgi:hypothetical protein
MVLLRLHQLALSACGSGCHIELHQECFRRHEWSLLTTAVEDDFEVNMLCHLKADPVTMAAPKVVRGLSHETLGALSCGGDCIKANAAATWKHQKRQ